jgi:hypothetical protein
MKDLDSRIARAIIDVVGSSGVPPEYGFQFFTVGLEPYLSVISEEYLSTFIKQGGSAFKMVIGVYGGGKTHFLYCVRDLAWQNNFLVSYVSLSSTYSPFHRLDLVYKAIVNGITPPLEPNELLSGYEKGIASFIRYWFGTKVKELYDKGLSKEELQETLLSQVENIEGIESISFAKAIKSAIHALSSKQEEDFANICQWLTVEDYDRRIHRRYGILQRIDRTTAFVMFRSLVRWIREIGFSGLVILLDEAERLPSLSTREKELHLNNLRELIDECGHTSFQGVMIFYAVPDENFLQGRTQIYEALKQRVSTIFDSINPTGVKIELEKLSAENPIVMLEEVGDKLRQIYEVAYSRCFENYEDVKETIHTIAKKAYEQRFMDIGYKRLFVQKAIQGLHFLKQKGHPPSATDLDM